MKKIRLIILKNQVLDPQKLPIEHSLADKALLGYWIFNLVFFEP